MSEDILERAKKALIDDDMTYEDYDECISLLIAEVERLRSLIDKPPEEADWVADYHLLQSALDGPIIDAARKWHAAYRKAQNSNLMRAKEVERLRSENLDYSCIARDLDFDITKKARLIDAQHDGILRLRKRLAAKDARIKELEEMIRQLGSLAFMGDMPLDQIVAHFIAWGQSNYDYTSRLEVAFLRSNAAMRYYQEGNRGPWPQLGEKFKEPYQEKAREELERIRNGE